MALRSYLVGEVVEDFADGLLTRREALRRLALLGVTVGGSALLAACGDGSEGGTSAPAATTSAPGTASPAADDAIRFAGPRGELQAAWAAAARPQGSVLVIHENRGLTPHFFDLVSRFARDGYSALCVDLLSEKGGTSSLGDPAAAPTLLADAPDEQLISDLGAGIEELRRRATGVKVGTVGFCFGGGMVWNLLQAGDRRLSAAIPCYGPAPDNPDFSRATAAVYAIYAEQDSRVNASRPRAETALKAAGLPYQVRTFAGADHAFFNDTGQRYHEAAAREAYRAMLNWFGRYL